MPTQDPIYYVEKVEVEDDGDSDSYDEVRFEDDISESETEEDLETALRTMKNSIKGEETPQAVVIPKATVSKRAEVVDDFIRNFLIRNKMTRTLEAFQREWFELHEKGQANTLEMVPDCYVQIEELENRVKFLHKEMGKMKKNVNNAGTQFIKIRKERDFHRMHHRRIVQEKEKLFADIRRLKKHYESYEPALSELRGKYETAMREKMLTKIECEKNLTKITNLTTTLTNYETVRGTISTPGGPVPEISPVPVSAAAGSIKEHPSDTVIRAEAAENPNIGASIAMTSHLTRPGGFRETHSFKAHDMAISGLALHPTKPVIATVSDDTKWRLWSMPEGECVMTGHGHDMWIGGCGFNPEGTRLATGSGDTTVKVWDFAEGSCMHSFSDHSHPVWDVAWHHSGQLVASASMDNTSKLFDMGSMRCRSTFRGHSDSVNSISFLPFSNVIATCSADKSIMLWDIRTGLSVQSLLGHVNAINCVTFDLCGELLASCDAYGVVKIWDVRRGGVEAGHWDYEPHPVNSVSFDSSGACLAVSSNDGTVKMLEVEKGVATELTGHDDGVQAALFSRDGDMLISASSDSTVKVWS